jgi:hypothetical protein
MSVCYAASSAVATWAIGRNLYYSGSLFDIPLVTAMAWVTWIGLTNVKKPTSEAPESSTLYGVWVARCSMIAVFSLPLFAAWALSDAAVPAPMRVFRLTLTFIAAFVMGIMVLMRQSLLERELTQQRPLAAKIGQYVRRTKSLVASLISFARQTPAAKTPLDVNTLARTAVKLTQSQWEALEIEVRTQFDPELPKVLGDSNQLLQVCQQLMANCLHLLNDSGGRVLVISTERKEETAVLQIACAQQLSSTDSDCDSLGMSACQGILQEHRGRISRERGEDGAILLRVELPILEPADPRLKESMPALWQSQPFA